MSEFFSWLLVGGNEQQRRKGCRYDVLRVCVKAVICLVGVWRRLEKG